MSHLLFLLVCVIWGTSFVWMKYALPAFGPVGVGAGRVLLGAAALGLLWRWRKQRWPLRRGDLGALSLLALLGYAVPFVIQPWLIERVDERTGHGTALAGMMVSFVPLLTIVVSVPMLGVRPSRRQLLGVVGGLGCMAFLFSRELEYGVPLGYLLVGAITPVLYSFANTYVKRRFHDVPPMALSMVAMLLSAVVLLPTSVAFRPEQVPVRIGAAVVSLAVLGVVCTGLAGYMFYVLIREQGPLFASMVTYIIPCVALLAAWIIDEPLTLAQLVALAGAFAMVALVQSERRPDAVMKPALPAE